MLYKLVKIMNGNEIVDSINTLKIINNRKKSLASSYRGKNVQLLVLPAEDDEEKYQKPLADGSYVGGDYDRTKFKTKNKIRATKRKNK